MLASCLFAVALCLAFLMPGTQAVAGQGDNYSRLRPLFQFDQPHPAAPRRAAKPARAKSNAASPRPTQPKRKTKPAAPAAVALPTKAADAKVVLIVGDSFGQALAGGLEEGFADAPGVRMVNAALSSRGLTSDGTSLPQADGREPDAVVIMLGGNDRRSLRHDGKKLSLRSTAWNEVYAGRAAALAAEAERRNVPLFWVGLPAVASAKASADFLAFNELFRAATEANSGVFIDSWDGFVDEADAFAAFGPGVDGQRVRLRTKDGMGFTRAGRRKLAFFVARPLAKALRLPLPAGLPPEPPGDVAGSAPATGRTAPMGLRGYSPAGGEVGELLGGPDAAPSPASGSSLYDLPAVPGRADDFSTPPAETTPRPATR